MFPDGTREQSRMNELHADESRFFRQMPFALAPSTGPPNGPQSGKSTHKLAEVSNFRKRRVRNAEAAGQEGRKVVDAGDGVHRRKARNTGWCGVISGRAGDDQLFEVVQSIECRICANLLISTTQSICTHQSQHGGFDRDLQLPQIWQGMKETLQLASTDLPPVQAKLFQSPSILGDAQENVMRYRLWSKPSLHWRNKAICWRKGEERGGVRGSAHRECRQLSEGNAVYRGQVMEKPSGKGRQLMARKSSASATSDGSRSRRSRLRVLSSPPANSRSCSRWSFPGGLNESRAASIASSPSTSRRRRLCKARQLSMTSRRLSAESFVPVVLSVRCMRWPNDPNRAIDDMSGPSRK